MANLEKIVTWILDNNEWLFSGVGVALASQIIRLVLKQRSSKLNQRVNESLPHYPTEVIERARENYIKPHCQVNNFAHNPDDKKARRSKASVRNTNGKREDLFKTIDAMLEKPVDNKYIILLGETGTGKTSFVLNYYARYLRRGPKTFRLQVVPLGIPDAEIQKLRDMANQANTVLFLDALDEDIRAVRNHRERVSELCRLASGFRCLLMTCRTQFFPREEEEPRETDVAKVGVIRLGEEGEYIFQKRYLSLFDERQLRRFLWRKYSFFHWFKYRSARTVIERYRELAVRPMILQYVDDLYKSKRGFTYSYQLYEAIVGAWFKREVGRVEGLMKKEDRLRDFCETLAVELLRRQQRDSVEQLSYDEIAPFAKEANLETWKATGRSLLIRAGGSSFRFAHRSIMEYLFVRRFVGERKVGDQVAWSAQMSRFLLEMVDDAREGGEVVEFAYKLRAKSRRLSDSTVTEMVKERGFYDLHRNETDKGFSHSYVPCTLEGEHLIVDLATGLTWQQSGSPERMASKESQKYIQKLRDKKYAGFSDWRLPTLEETMSLMEPKKNEHGLHINPIFDKTKATIWTADKESASRAWHVDFHVGSCFSEAPDGYSVHVRAVR